jgi:hypothetical protein
MRRLALVLAIAALAPSTAPGAGCSPIDCGPSATSLGGQLLAVRPLGINGPVRVLDLANGRTRWRLPAGILTRTALVHQDGTLLTWFDTATGARLADAIVPQRGAYSLVGASADGRIAVLARTQRKKTTFALVGPHSARSVTLGGHANWSFDALSGGRLYLLQYLRNGYEVRLYDLAHNRLDPTPLKDAHESALIRGLAWERLASADGRYLFTLYIGSTGGAMIHELDLRSATARCIDLPGHGDFNASASYALALSPDGQTLWAASTGYGVVAAVDVASAKARELFRFTPSSSGGPIAPAVALSAHGDLLALALANHVWVVDLKARRVRREPPHVAIALGFSPDTLRLWMVGERSRVSALVLR